MTSTTTSQSKLDEFEDLKIHQGVSSSEVGDEYVLLHLDTGMYHGLDGVGAVIWSEITQGTSISAIPHLIASEYGIEEETARSDLIALVEQLIDAQILVPS